MRHTVIILGISLAALLSATLLFFSLLPSPKKLPQPAGNIPNGTPIPTSNEQTCSCPYEEKPVCGSDYTSYRSACDAKCSDVAVAYEGACKVFPTTQPLPASCTSCSLSCPSGQVTFADEKGCPVCACRYEESFEQDSDGPPV